MFSIDNSHKICSYISFFFNIIFPLVGIIIGALDIESDPCGGTFNVSHWLVIGQTFILYVNMAIIIINMLTDDASVTMQRLGYLLITFNMIWTCFGIYILSESGEKCRKNHIIVYGTTIFLIVFGGLRVIEFFVKYLISRFRK